MKKWIPLGLLLGLCCVPVWADPTAEVAYNSVYGTPVKFTTHYINWRHTHWTETTAGILSITVDDDPYQALCIDPYEYASSYDKIYNVRTLNDALGSKADDVAFLLDQWTDAMEKDQAAGLQLAIWEVIVDDSYDLYGGDFRMSKRNDTDVSEAAITYLEQLENAPDVSSDSACYIALTNDGYYYYGCKYKPGYQDYVIKCSPVPVPGALLLVGIGMICTGRTRKRHPA